MNFQDTIIQILTGVDMNGRAVMFGLSESGTLYQRSLRSSEWQLVCNSPVVQKDPHALTTT